MTATYVLCLAKIWMQSYQYNAELCSPYKKQLHHLHIHNKAYVIHVVHKKNVRVEQCYKIYNRQTNNNNSNNNTATANEIPRLNEVNEQCIYQNGSYKHE